MKRQELKMSKRRKRHQTQTETSEDGNSVKDKQEPKMYFYWLREAGS